MPPSRRRASGASHCHQPKGRVPGRAWIHCLRTADRSASPLPRKCLIHSRSTRAPPSARVDNPSASPDLKKLRQIHTACRCMPFQHRYGPDCLRSMFTFSSPAGRPGRAGRRSESPDALVSIAATTGDRPGSNNPESWSRGWARLAESCRAAAPVLATIASAASGPAPLPPRRLLAVPVLTGTPRASWRSTGSLLRPQVQSLIRYLPSESFRWPDVRPEAKSVPLRRSP